MKIKITGIELQREAIALDLAVQHENGYRVVQGLGEAAGWRFIFPRDGTYVSKDAIAGFLIGVKWERGEAAFKIAMNQETDC